MEFIQTHREFQMYKLRLEGFTTVLNKVFLFLWMMNYNLPIVYYSIAVVKAVAYSLILSPPIL